MTLQWFIRVFDCQWRLSSCGFCDEVLTLLFYCKLLFIDSNEIKTLPTEIGELTNLQTLYLGKWSWWFCIVFLGFWFSMTNEFSWFFATRCSPCCFYWKSPFIDDNDIRSIPTEIGELTNLQYMYLGKWTWWFCIDFLGFWFSMTNEFSWFLWRGAHLAVFLQITLYSFQPDNINSNGDWRADKLAISLFA